jgi:hypothetical protein
MDSRKLVFILFAFATAGVHAQTAGVVTLRANQTSATGSLVPVLTWSTNPVATSCRASGGWSGDKAVSGTQTLPSINASTNYTLTCSWGNGTATLSWVPPTTNTNGSPLTDLAGYRVVYGTSASALTQMVTVSDVTARQATISALPAGTWHFAMRAFNTRGNESSNTVVGSKSVTGATAAATVPITITAPPTTPPPTTPPAKKLMTFETRVGDVAYIEGVWRVTRIVGSIPLKTACDSSFRIGTWYRVSRSAVTLTRTPRSQTLVARCSLQ